MLSFQNPYGSLSHFLQVSAKMSPAKDSRSGTVPLLYFTYTDIHIFTFTYIHLLPAHRCGSSNRPPSLFGNFSWSLESFLSMQMCYDFSLDLTSPSALFFSSTWQQNLLTELTCQLDLNCQHQSPPPVLSWTLSHEAAHLLLLRSPATWPIVNPRGPGSSYLSAHSFPAPLLAPPPLRGTGSACGPLCPHSRS